MCNAQRTDVRAHKIYIRLSNTTATTANRFEERNRKQKKKRIGSQQQFITVRESRTVVRKFFGTTSTAESVERSDGPKTFDGRLVNRRKDLQVVSGYVSHLLGYIPTAALHDPKSSAIVRATTIPIRTIETLNLRCVYQRQKRRPATRIGLSRT